MALKPLNSVGGFSVGEIPANVIFPNTDFSGANANFAGNLKISNATASWGVFTDNLYYSNGTPWDFNNPAGANYQLQYYSGGEFGASANLAYDPATSNLTVIGNILTNAVSVSGNITAANFQGALANGSSNVAIPAVNGNVNLTAGGNTTLVVTATGANITGTASVTGNLSSGNADLGNLATANYINVASNVIAGNLTVNAELSGNTANFTGNVVVPNLAVNLELAGNTANFTGNVQVNNLDVNVELSGNTANFTGNVIVPNLTVNLELAGNTANFTGNVQVNNLDVNAEISGNTANFSGNVVVPNLQVNLELAGNTANFTGNVQVNNLDVNVELSGNTANFTGNVVVPNLTVNLELAGNTANFTGNVQVNNLDVNAELSGNTANFSGNVVVPNLTVNLELQANTANFDGNVQMDKWLTVSNVANVGTLRTDNLQYANGANWDLQEAAGSNGQIQFNDGNNNFGASANLAFDTTTSTLTVTGNANVTGSVNTDDINSGSNSLTVNANGYITTFGANGTVTFPGNISAGNISGNITGNISGNFTISGPNLAVVWNSNGVANTDANFTFDYTTDTIHVPNISTPVGSNANLVLEPDGSGLVVIANTAGGATAVAMGDPTLGNLVSNAVTLTNSSSVSNAIAQLNEVLGKLVPPAPPAFPASQTLTIQTLSTYRMANFTQTDNTPGANKNVAGGTTVSSVRRASSYSTSNITVAGPGNSGNIVALLNGTAAGSRTLTNSLNGNGTYSNLVIFNNYDYNSANANITAGFWSVFSTRAAGTVTEGWNEVQITDSAAGNSNTPSWYYDASTPGTPTFSNVAFTAPVSPTYEYSSTVPHYPSTNQFTASFDVNRLSGDMYPTSDNFVTGTAGGAFSAPTSVSYATAGVTTPLARNLYVSSGNVTVTTTANVITGFGSSSGSPSVSAFNSYNTGTQNLSPGNTVLYKTGTVSSASRIEEANVFIGSTIGSGSGLAFRIINPGSGNTPTYSANATAFNSQSSTLQTYDATVVANILKHDQTNYSTGYLPAGPDLSAGRSGTQYFTFKIVRTSVSKFDIKWSGNIAGLWVALPGSTIDSTSTLNGWLDMSVAYQGAGVPGANTGAGGNGSNGAALGGTAPLNSAQTNKAVTATFGTVSSSSTATNEIYVRIALTSGQSVTALSLQAASN
jgi:cytoskeletal protein CcmA (bactofilin family)